MFEESDLGLLGSGLLLGTRILVPQALQRTVLPLAISGIESTFLQVRFGHMIRTMFWSDITISYWSI